jgi:hypothetical protein
VRLEKAGGAFAAAAGLRSLSAKDKSIMLSDVSSAIGLLVDIRAGAERQQCSAVLRQLLTSAQHRLALMVTWTEEKEAHKVGYCRECGSRRQRIGGIMSMAVARRVVGGGVEKGVEKYGP